MTIETVAGLGGSRNQCNTGGARVISTATTGNQRLIGGTEISTAEPGAVRERLSHNRGEQWSQQVTHQ